jgi:dihydropteroate synthase
MERRRREVSPFCVWGEVDFQTAIAAGPAFMKIDFPNYSLTLNKPVAMGVLNTTPDSFSDGGCYEDLRGAVEQGRKLAADGAAIVDVGGESTRPGAQSVSADREARRVVPVIEELGKALDVPVSIDTSKPEVMVAAVNAGAQMINDVCALRSPGALSAAAELGVPVCIMHMQGEPRSMQVNPDYADVVEEVYAFLSKRIDACLAAGINERKIILDPGFGFGKTLEHNLSLMNHLEKFVTAGLPVLIGVSRKSMIGSLLDRPVGERLYGGLSLSAIAAYKGAHILRTHDVGPTLDAISMAEAVRQGR